MNKAMLIGWIVEQPEIKISEDGKLECSVDIAINRPGNIPDVITLTASRENAEAIADFKQGERIGITGNIKTKIRTDKFDKPYKVTEVEVERVDLGKKQESPFDNIFLPETVRYSIDERDRRNNERSI